jgi:hypothetical protein
VYNNPVTNGAIQVALGRSCNLKLYDTEGRLLWQEQASAGLELIDVSRYAKGIYLLKAGDQVEKVLVR